MEIGEPKRTREVRPLAEPVPEQIPVPEPVEVPTPATEPVEAPRSDAALRRVSDPSRPQCS